jgi:hypothetical protein
MRRGVFCQHLNTILATARRNDVTSRFLHPEATQLLQFDDTMWTPVGGAGVFVVVAEPYS